MRKVDVERHALGVDQDLTAACGFEDPAFTVDQVLDLRRAGDAQEHDVRSADQASHVLGLLGATAHQILHRLTVAMSQHCQRESFLHQVLRYAVTHESRPDKADLLVRHSSSQNEKPLLQLERHGVASPPPMHQ